jgi:hypothetical protein
MTDAGDVTDHFNAKARISAGTEEPITLSVVGNFVGLNTVGPTPKNSRTRIEV